MKFKKIQNFCWGMAFATCLSGIIHHREHIIIPSIIMILIGFMFIVNLNENKQ
jgi:hypothetical protein